MSRFSTGPATLARMRDEVDDLVEAWARERDDLDLDAIAVFSRISRLARHLDLARREAFNAHGIESWEFDVLAALRRAGAPYEMSPGRLLRETLVTSGTMTNRVDRLAARGFVERSPDPDDRRGVIVRLTAEGKTAVDGAFEALVAAESRLLADLPAARARPPRRPAAHPARAVRLTGRAGRSLQQLGGLQPLQLERRPSRRPARSARR